MKKLQNKLSVRFFMLIVVTMTVTAVLTISLTSRQIHQSLLERLNDSSKGVEIEIKNLRQDLSSRVKAISEDQDVILAFKNKDRDVLLRLLQSLREVIGADIAAAIDSNGIVLARGHSPAQYGDDVSKSTSFQRTQKGQEVIDFVSGISGMAAMVFVPVKMEEEIIGQLNIGKLLKYGFIKRLKNKYGLDFIVYDKEQLQATTFTNPQSIDNPELRNLGEYIQTHKDSFIKDVWFGGKPYFVMAKPIFSNNKQVLGAYFLAISQETIHRTITLLTVLFCLITALLLLVNLFVCRRISVKITEPIKKLSVTALEIAKGDLSKKVDVISQDEVGILAESFNKMTESLSKTTTSIQNLEAEIENRKQAEEALRTSQEKYRSIRDDVLDCSEVGFFILDADFKVVWINRSIESFFGLERNKVLGKDKRELILTKISDIFENPQEFIDKVISTYDNNTYIERFECHVLSSEKRQDRWLEHRSFPILTGLYAGGRIEHYIDITERKRAEMALLESQQHFSSIAKTAKDAIVSADISGTIILWNPAAEEMFGFSADEIIGKPLTTIMPERYHKAHLKGLDRVAKTGKTRITDQVIKLYGLRKDATEFPLELTLAKWETDNGTFFTAVIRDITERKEAEEEQKHLIARLDEKNKELERFSSIIRHDFGNPMTSIDAFSSVLAKTSGQIMELLDGQNIDHKVKNKLLSVLTDEIPSSVGYIQDAIKQMNTLLDGLNQIVTVGRIPTNIERLDMNKLVKEVTGTMKYQFENAEATLIVGELPDCAGDKNQIKRVFTNLLTNSVKYLDPNRKGRIQISGKIEQDQSVYCVEDNGIGISSENQENIFDVFYRVDSTHPAGGEGLGLPIVVKILERHNGKIRIESELGKASRFFVSLPTTKT